MDINEYKNLNNLPQSYWIASTPDTNYPALNQDIDVDLLIIGGGMAGLSCAYQLKDSGLSIAIMESDRILKGTTGYTTAKITSQHGLIYDKKKKSLGENLTKQYANANEHAIKEIKRIIDSNKIDCDYISQSSFIYTQDEQYIKQIEDEVKAASSFGIKASYTEEIPLEFPIKAGVRFDNQAQFHPRKYLLGVAKLIIESGIQVFEQTRAVELNNHIMDSYIITTSKGNKITAKKVIIASHYPFYNKHSMYYARLYQERSYIVAIKAKEKFPGGMYINCEEPTRSLRSHISDEGELILVVGEDHKTGQGEDTNDHYKSLINFADKNFTIDDIPYRWSTQDCMTLDGIPYVGQYSADFKNLYIATGFGKWGMTNSTVASILLRDLILRGSSACSDLYDPSRKTIAASAKEFIVQNTNLAGQLLDGKLSKLPKDIDILPGEARVVEMDNKRTGAYKDEDGNLHLVNTTCTHMGCELNWNNGERSWDCPCHGSRFSVDGDILEGPAVKPLSFEDDVNTLKKVIKEDF